MNIRSEKEAHMKGAVPLAIDIKSDYIPQAFKPVDASTRWGINRLFGKKQAAEAPKLPAFAVRIQGDGVSLLADGTEKGHFSGDIYTAKASEAARETVALATIMERAPRTAIFGQALKGALLSAFDMKTVDKKNRTTAYLATHLSTVSVQKGLLALNSLRIQYDGMDKNKLTEGGRATIEGAFSEAEAFDAKRSDYDAGSVRRLSDLLARIIRNLPVER